MYLSVTFVIRSADHKPLSGLMIKKPMECSDAATYCFKMGKILWNDKFWANPNENVRKVIICWKHTQNLVHV